MQKNFRWKRIITTPLVLFLVDFKRSETSRSINLAGIIVEAVAGGVGIAVDAYSAPP
jgi:hypothetical protein